LDARPLILHMAGYSPISEIPDRVIERPVESVYSWDVVQGWELGPFEGPPTLKSLSGNIFRSCKAF
jgi:hypothetical protein